MKKVVKRIFQFPLVEKIIALLSANKELDHLFAKLPAYCSFYPPNSIRFVKRRGISYELDLSDYMEWLVFYGIRVEPREKLYSLAQPDHTVLDIGSNIGEVALNLAKKVANGGHVHCFEPDPVSFRKVKRNSEINQFSNLTLYNFGLGEKSQTVTLAPETKSNRGGVRVTKRGHPDGNIIAIVALDDWMNDTGNFNVHLIKIDVEGYELKVLKGGERTLRQFHPTLFVELNDENLKVQGDSARDLIEFLLNSGYSRIRRADTGQPTQLTTDFRHCHYDIIAQ